MFRIRLLSMPSAFTAEKASGLINALVAKMTELMFKLQSKIVGEEIPRFFPQGASNIPATVRAIPAELDGSVIRGAVEAGGPRTTKITLWSGQAVDYAAVQHEGIDHSYIIRPFNKEALAFMLDGKRIIVKQVTHPGLRARPFMSQGLHDMQAQIVAELQAELTELMG